MNKTKLPSLIPILVLTLITVIMWVSLDVYRALKKPADAAVSATISQPLIPTLDQNIINQIESRNYFNDSQVPDSVINSSPTPTIIPIPVASRSAQPKNATGSAITP